MRYRVEIAREDDGRFLAEVMELPGVVAYGRSAEEALAHVQALALRVLADPLEHDEGPRGPASIQFETSAACWNQSGGEWQTTQSLFPSGSRKYAP